MGFRDRLSRKLQSMLRANISDSPLNKSPPTDKSQGKGIPPANDFAGIIKRQSARIMYENRIIVVFFFEFHFAPVAITYN